MRIVARADVIYILVLVLNSACARPLEWNAAIRANAPFLYSLPLR